MPLEAKDNIVNIAKKGLQTFEDFGKKNDVFLVTKDEHNIKVLRFIQKYKLDFQFYLQKQPIHDLSATLRWAKRFY